MLYGRFAITMSYHKKVNAVALLTAGIYNKCMAIIMNRILNFQKALTNQNMFDTI